MAVNATREFLKEVTEAGEEAAQGAGKHAEEGSKMGGILRMVVQDLLLWACWGLSWALGGIESGSMAWDDMLPDQYDLSGSAVGWGLNLSSNVKISKDVLRLQLVYGAGIENYMNEGPADVAAETNPGDARKPLKGKALPLLGFVAMLDHVWNERWGSTVGYSHVNITPSNAQRGDAFKLGHYILANVTYTPVPNFMGGCELQVGQRINNSDGWKYTDVRIQFGAKYSFSQLLGG